MPVTCKKKIIFDSDLVFFLRDPLNEFNFNYVIIIIKIDYQFYLN